MRKGLAAADWKLARDAMAVGGGRLGGQGRYGRIICTANPIFRPEAEQ